MSRRGKRELGASHQARAVKGRRNAQPLLSDAFGFQQLGRAFNFAGGSGEDRLVRRVFVGDDQVQFFGRDEFLNRAERGHHRQH